MTYADETKLYHHADWAAQRWDWFNEGRIVEPKSFCQFWRTVLLYATVALFGRPLARLLVSIPFPNLFWLVPSLFGHGVLIAAKAAWYVVRAGGRAVWFLTLPIRLIGRPAVSPALSAAVTAGKRMDSFTREHKKGVEILLTAFSILYLAGIAIFIITMLLFISWFWTLAGAGAIAWTGLAVYGFLKSGAPGLILDALVLLSDAALAAKHGICPPVRIIR